jgi:hypothetical protein
MISEKFNYDEEINSLSIESQLIFVKMLAAADDYGVLPANLYTLDKIINTPEKLKKKLEDYLKEILDKKLGYLFDYENKKYFMFKENSFDEIQSYLIKNRTKSEFLGLKRDIMEDYGKLREITGNSFEIEKSKSYHIERYKIRDKREEIIDNEDLQKLWITTWGRTPKIPEIEMTERFLEKFGLEKTKQIFKKATLDGFNKIKTLWESLDNEGNIKPKDQKQGRTVESNPA